MRDRVPSPPPARWRRRLVGAGVALAVTAALALANSTFHVIPTRGSTWRGILDAPGGLRVVVALLVGVACAWALSRVSGGLGTPVLALGLAATPLLPVFTGAGLGLLVFQGPALRLLLVVVLVVIVVRAIGGRDAGHRRVHSGVLFLVAFVYFLALGTRLPGAGPQGDEPQYLLMAHSMLIDHDLDLANQFAERQYLSFYGGALEPHASPASPPGTVYSTHSPGLAVLLLPAYALGGELGSRVAMCLLTALGAVFVRAFVRASGASERTALATWGVFALTPPLSFYALALYPETVAVFAVALLLWFRCRPPGRLSTAFAATVAGGLVWLHPKFLPVGVVALALLLLRVRDRRLHAIGVLGFAAAVGSFLLYMFLTFGRPTFSAGFGDPDLSPLLLPRGVLAQLFDRQWGLFAVAPVWFLFVPGVVSRLRKDAGDALALGFLAAAPIVVGGAYAIWWGGACPPARFPLPALPALAVFLAQALPRRRDLAAALAGLGLGIVLLAADAPRVLFNHLPGESGLLNHLASVDLNGFFPSFFDTGWGVPSLLALSMSAAGALTWRFGLRGLAWGTIAYLLVATAVRDRPVIDVRRAGLELLWSWDRDNWMGPMGAPDVTALALPLEMRGAPWTMKEGDSSRSRAVNLPPGFYDLELSARSLGKEDGELLVGARARGVTLVTDGLVVRGTPRLPILLPLGAPGLRVGVEALRGDAVIHSAAVVPRTLVPRRDRARLSWPRRLQPDAYRLSRGTAFVTAVAGAEPEAGGFHLTGAEGSFVLDGARADTVTVQIRRARPGPRDELLWGLRSVRLGPLADTVVWLPMAEGLPLGAHSVVAARLRAQGAWINFFGGPPGTR